MNTFQANMVEFKEQLKKGAIQKAYQGLMATMSDLRNQIAERHPELVVPGALYNGYLDMTYFSIQSSSLKERDLKIAVVFVYDSFRFEIWLSGKNKQILAKYWELFRRNGWDKHDLIEPGKGIDYIVQHVLVADPNFADLDALTQQVEQGALQFIEDIEAFLSGID